MILADMIGQFNLHISRDSDSPKWLTDIIWHTAARSATETYSKIGKRAPRMTICHLSTAESPPSTSSICGLSKSGLLAYAAGHARQSKPAQLGDRGLRDP